MKTYDDLDPKFKNLVTKGVKSGDTRVVNKKFSKGHKFVFKEYDRPFILNDNVTMDVTEVYRDGDWYIDSFKIDTIKPWTKAHDPLPGPGRWHRFLVWLGVRDKIPTARVL